jgi:uncharacterized hydrophobic protein (TIGR00271 family)
LTGSYLAMNAAATLIAGFGLLENSPAVIIGAMLIAMLLGPIVGVALGLAEADLPLLGRALLSEIAGVAWVLAIGYAVGTVARANPIGSEILSRTAPSILDLLIALVGGLAGGFTLVSPGLPGVVVGVAIATALVPPLTSCGILLAHGLSTAAGGAFLLFLANLTAIAVGAMIVFLLAGHRPSTQIEARKVMMPRLISVALFLLLAVYLTLTFRQTIALSVLQSNVRDTLTQETAKIPGARLAGLTIIPQQGAPIAWAVIRTPSPISPGRVAHLNDLVNSSTGRIVDLHVRSVITAETTRSGYIYEPSVPPGAEPNIP